MQQNCALLHTRIKPLICPTLHQSPLAEVATNAHISCVPSAHTMYLYNCCGVKSMSNLSRKSSGTYLVLSLLDITHILRDT